MLQINAKMPPDFIDVDTTSLCQKHYMCVCGKASQSSEPEDAWFCHQKMIRLLRPYLIVKRKPRQTTPAGDPQEAPAPQTKTFGGSKEACFEKASRQVLPGSLFA